MVRRNGLLYQSRFSRSFGVTKWFNISFNISFSFLDCLILSLSFILQRRHRTQNSTWLWLILILCFLPLKGSFMIVWLISKKFRSMVTNSFLAGGWKHFYPFFVGEFPMKMHLIALRSNLDLSLLGTWTYTLQPKTLGERKPRPVIWGKWLFKITIRVWKLRVLEGIVSIKEAIVRVASPQKMFRYISCKPNGQATSSVNIFFLPLRLM